MNKLTHSGRDHAATLKAAINPNAMLKRIFIVVAILSSVISASNVATAQETTEQVFTHHLKAFLDRNMEENLKDYTEDSVVIIPDAIFKGKEQIRGLFAGLSASLPSRG